MLIKLCGTSCAKRKACNSSHSETNPFSGGSPAMASAPIKGEPCHPGHPVNQAPQAPERSFTGGVQHRSRAKKQQPLHEGVIETVIEERDEREGRHGGHVDAAEDDGKAERGEYDAEILDRGVGQQSLHVGLGRRKNHSIQRRKQAEAERNEPHHHSGDPNRSKLTRNTP